MQLCDFIGLSIQGRPAWCFARNDRDAARATAPPTSCCHVARASQLRKCERREQLAPFAPSSGADVEKGLDQLAGLTVHSWLYQLPQNHCSMAAPSLVEELRTFKDARLVGFGATL